jgi:thiol-disulfide isomerase/thioredoxin
MKRVVFIILVVIVSIWVARTLTSKREAAGGSATARDGSAVEVAAIPGAPMTIVHFWGTWCPPCRRELPEFAAFQKDYGLKGVGFVTVADDPDFETVDRFLRGEGIDIEPMLLDASGAAARQWGVRVYPTTFVIGPANDILAVYRGMIDWASPLQRREILRLGGLEP